ncbi:hypothetical protein [Quadrisphaera setariae]|uniref:hypothetical protein n=1 Tax=Quadrisphaera setariae TaxID=2593304 RepID=UPI00164F4F29|nr:hypothetical protein [Quadrisphaera setariae]
MRAPRPSSASSRDDDVHRIVRPSGREQQSPPAQGAEVAGLSGWAGMQEGRQVTRVRV